MKINMILVALFSACAAMAGVKDDAWNWYENEALPLGGKAFTDTETFFERVAKRRPGLDASTAELRKALVKECKHHKGAARLFIDLRFSHDGAEDRLSLFSKKYTVSPGYELIDFLDQHGLRYQLVKKVTL